MTSRFDRFDPTVEPVTRPPGPFSGSLTDPVFKTLAHSRRFGRVKRLLTAVNGKESSAALQQGEPDLKGLNNLEQLDISHNQFDGLTTHSGMITKPPQYQENNEPKKM
ncbi:hypothetical protein HYC85_011370 [Camellia sinensis]|uniref:Uncharacterized protein n=1 Tax=Camellia sinensis TaxID=4442 RepID=A0A7J7HA27_CAMSI|nr:hypothetical protein HYC85_011370 [Camellia sinensis]